MNLVEREKEGGTPVRCAVSVMRERERKREGKGWRNESTFSIT